jgi:hypothetical protein
MIRFLPSDYASDHYVPYSSWSSVVSNYSVSGSKDNIGGSRIVGSRATEDIVERFDTCGRLRH